MEKVISYFFVTQYMSKLFGNKNSDFEIKSLELHNAYRREHGAPPLILNIDLCKISQSWAEELAKRDEMAYSHNEKYGENVFVGWAKTSETKITPQDCIEKWYSEINDFSFGREPKVLNCGHFTQIVWKTTQQLGVGRAKSKSGKVYVVANYYPSGNYSGQFSKNVPPPRALEFSSSSSSGLQDSSIERSSVSELSTPSQASQYQDSPSPRHKGNFMDLTQTVMKVRLHHDKKLFEREFLAAHNEYRSIHGVPPLLISKTINTYAAEWATEIAQRNTMQHRDQDKYGENIFYAWSSAPNFVVYGKDPVDKWYSEIKDFKFGREPTDLAAGHFTQVVWKSCKKVGVALAKSQDGKVFVVANYYPPGNVVGHFKENVPPPVNE